MDELEKLRALIDYRKYNRAEFFKPHPFQRKMFRAGVDHTARFACLGNRVGKTVSAAYEMTYHLTGRYPSSWEGHRFTKPIRAWAIGITGESTRKVLQLELLGTLDIRHSEKVGTGFLPRDVIKMDLIEKDGPTAKVVYVDHYDSDGNIDGQSILEFRSTQQGHMALAGAAVDFILLDEEDEHDSLAIFSQCLTRLATTKGKLLITATPEHGMTSLIQHFYKEPNLFIFHAGWDEASHLSEEVKQDLLKGIPEWEREMRTKGLPAKGSGAIFQVDDSEITVEPFDIPSHWPLVVGVDFGRSRDPSTIVYATMDPETEVTYIIDEVYLDQDRSPENMAKNILQGRWPQVPVVVPHDGNSVTTDGGNETRATVMRNLGVNVMSSTFSNSSEIQLSITSVHKKHMGKEGGLVWMGSQMKAGKFKVFSTCRKFFEEKMSYFYIMKGGKFYPKDGDDHVIDAARIASISLGRHGLPVYQCYTGYVDDTPLYKPWAY